MSSFRSISLSIALLCLGVPTSIVRAAEKAPLRLGVIGLVHGHARGFLAEPRDREDIDLVGVAEPDAALGKAYAKRFKLDASLFYTDIETMLDKTKPEAVALMTSTYDHLKAVEICAARGIHVMMEKPLAVSMEHARAMKRVAEKANIHLLVNYETTWYRSNHAAYAIAKKKRAIGGLRKIVVHDGHKGPVEIKCPPEFLEWLTDPVLNGGGALTDFGCYGANLITWLMDGRRPDSVTAVTQRIKPDVYPKVDDEATIIVTYPETQGVIQASWNWPFNRKDMEVYGKTGYVQTIDAKEMRVRLESGKEEVKTADSLKKPYTDPLSYLTAVVRGEIEPSGLSSLENNMLVTEILDAARESAKTGKTIRLR